MMSCDISHGPTACQPCHDDVGLERYFSFQEAIASWLW